MPTWRIYYDFDRDGIGAGDEITQWVIDAEWSLGARDADQMTADESRCTLTLKNVDKRWSPEYSSSPYTGKLRPHRLIRIDRLDGTVTTTMWTGWLSELDVEWSAQGNRRATMKGVGAKEYLESKVLEPPLLEGYRSDQVIEWVLTNTQLPPIFQGWQLGVSRLGIETKFADLSDAATLETGKTTLPFVGDNADKSRSAYAFISDVVAAERGFFFYDRTGKAQFWNRHHFPGITSNAGTATEADLTSMTYSYGQDVATVVTVKNYPRSVGVGTADLLWAQAGTVTITANSTRTVSAKFNRDGVKVGGRNIITPTTGNGYLAYTGDLAISIVAKGQSADVVLVGGATGARITTLELHGQTLTQWDEELYTATDEDNLAELGRREHVVDTPLLSDGALAQQIAYYELARRAVQGRVKSISLRERNDNAVKARWEIGTRIRVDEGQTEHDADYFVIGEQHRLENVMRTHDATFYLRPASRETYWQLGVSQLGIDTKLSI